MIIQVIDYNFNSLKGPLLARNLAEAVSYFGRQKAILDELSAQFHVDTLKAWSDSVYAWENGAEYNPYEEKENSMVQFDITVQLFNHYSTKTLLSTTCDSKLLRRKLKRQREAYFNHTKRRQAFFLEPDLTLKSSS
jgi:hypothetical protein